MKSGIKLFLIASVAVALSALPAVAQDHGSHAAAAPHAASGTGAVQHGGTFSSGGRIVSMPTVNRGNPQPHLQRPYGNRYGYAYGTPILLPYDSEYDQLQGRGTFDQGQADEAPDNRVGPTIFEHNGQPSSAGSDSRYGTHRFQNQPPQEDSDSAPAAAMTPTLLVFRDGHQQEVGNYAITGTKLIVLGEKKTQKIQLTDLDLNATAKANEDRGVDFKMPNQS